MGIETKKFSSRDHPEVRGTSQRQVDARRAFLRVGDICANVMHFALVYCATHIDRDYCRKSVLVKTDFHFAIDARLIAASIN